MISLPPFATPPHRRDHAAPKLAAVLVAVWFALAPAAPAQGEHVNYEVGPVSPLAIATLQSGTATRTIVMVCNTSNDALEFYDTQPLRLIKAVPTGLSPVTVRWDPTSGSLQFVLGLCLQSNHTSYHQRLEPFSGSCRLL